MREALAAVAVLVRLELVSEIPGVNNGGQRFVL